MSLPIQGGALDGVVPSEIVLLQSDDWEALFRHGQCVCEGHSLPAWILCEVFAGTANLDWRRHDIKAEWMEDNGSFGIGYSLDSIPPEAYA